MKLSLFQASKRAGTTSRMPRRNIRIMAFDKTPAKVWQTPADKAAKDARPKIPITINGREYQIHEGDTVLDACRDLGIYVPTLCNHPRLPTSPGTCKLCQAEVDGKLKPACKTPATANMVVATDTEACEKNVIVQLTALKSCHPMECVTCPANGDCELQDLWARYGVSEPPGPQPTEATNALIDLTDNAIQADWEKCIKCGRCVQMCQDVQLMNVLGWVGKGKDRRPGPLANVTLDHSKCIECGQCTAVCPTGTLHEREEWQDVLKLLDNKRKVMVAQTAPSVRVAIGEEMGMEHGAISTGQMVAGLKKLGFDFVFDTNYSADLTIMEEGTELLGRLKAAWEHGEDSDHHAFPAHDTHAHAEGAHEHHAGPLPMFTSCCPAWINFVEKEAPDLIPHLSTCKSPQQMLGPVIKNYWSKKYGVKPEDIVMVSIMPCTAKKHEADRPEFETAGPGIRDIDYVLTTRELGRLFKARKIPMATLPPVDFDNPLGEGSGAAQIFGTSGGVMEAAVRTAYEVATGEPLPNINMEAARGYTGIKEATLHVGDHDVKVAIAANIGHARNLVEEMRKGNAHYDFIEVMACPGGCVGGGGQPKAKEEDVWAKRAASTYKIDEKSVIRKSHENKSVQNLYKEFMGEPNGEVAHKYLHTEYTDRSKDTVAAAPPPPPPAKKPAPAKPAAPAASAAPAADAAPADPAAAPAAEQAPQA